MTNEDKELLESIIDIDYKTEEEDFLMMLETDKKDSKEKGDNKELEKSNKEKFNGIVKEVKEMAKNIYEVSDEDFVEGKFFPQLTRLIVRVVILAVTIKIGFSFGIIKGIIVGVLAFTTDQTIKKNVDIKKRKRLRAYYTDKLEYIETKIEALDTNDKDYPEKKYNLIQVKNELKRNISKLNVQGFEQEKS